MSYIERSKRDAERLDKWRESSQNKINRYGRYGGSFKSAMRMSQSTDADKATQGSTWLNNRGNDGFVGRGRYRRKRRYRGRGAYYGGRGSFWQHPGKSMSKFARHMTTRQNRRDIAGIGTAALGSLAGDAVANQRLVAYGQGAYGVDNITASNNVIIDGTSAGAVPSFGSMSDEQGDIVISHREYVSDIYGNASGVSFAVDQFTLNPGIEKTFPFLSQLAANFTEYEFIQLMFTFRSTVADIGSSSNGQVGTIIMATQYNPDEAAFVDKANMMQYAHANSDKVTTSQLHGVECDPSQNAGPAQKYIRTNPLGTLRGDSVRYDQGVFSLGIHGTPSGFQDQSIGELWVTYTVRLNKPRLYTGIGKSISQDLFVNNPTHTPIVTDLVGSNFLSGQENGIGGLFENGPNWGFIYTFPANYHGYVEVLFVLEGSGIAATAMSNTVSGEVSKVDDLYGAGNPTGTNDPEDHIQTDFGSSGRKIIVQHLHVLNNTSAGANQYACHWVLTAGTVSQWYVVVREYNRTDNTPNKFADQTGLEVSPV